MAKIKTEAAQRAMEGAVLRTDTSEKVVSIEQYVDKETGEIIGEKRIIRRGRPPKKDGDTIYKRITINCNKEEYEAIEAKAKALGELTPGIEYNPTMLTKIAIMQYVKN